MTYEYSKKRRKQIKQKAFWNSIPKASDIKITHADGSVTYKKVDGKQNAANIIRKKKT
jgi:hypothetical protein